MVKEEHRSSGAVKARYVKKSPGQDFYKWCEQSLENPEYDVAQGTCDADDLPEAVREKCDEYDGYMYACEWPMH